MMKCPFFSPISWNYICRKNGLFQLTTFINFDETIAKSEKKLNSPMTIERDLMMQKCFCNMDLIIGCIVLASICVHTKILLPLVSHGMKRRVCSKLSFDSAIKVCRLASSISGTAGKDCWMSALHFQTKVVTHPSPLSLEIPKDKAINFQRDWRVT